MSLSRQNPLDLSTLGNMGGESILIQVKDLDRRIKQAASARHTWMHKQEKLFRQRLGIRRKKVFPWPGANNHNWPLVDKVIRRWKPSMAALITQSDPVAHFFPLNTAGVRAKDDVEAYYHYKFNSIENVEDTVMELLEYVAQHGKGYTIQGWNYQTERQCRIIFARSLFPQGVEAAVEQFNARVEQARTEAQQAIDAGQAPANALDQSPAPTTPEQFVMDTLQDEYNLRQDNPLEYDQIVQVTEKILAGAEKVKIYYRIVRHDKLSWVAVSPLDAIEPPRNQKVDDAEYIAFRHRFSADDLMKMAVDGHFIPQAVAGVVEKMKSRAMSDPERNNNFEGLSVGNRLNITTVLDRSDGIDNGRVEEPNQDDFLEVYCKIDINGDGIKERCRLWYHPDLRTEPREGSDTGPFGGTILALYALPFSFSEWPVVRHEFEHRSNRPYGSRGIAEHLSVHQATKNKLHNARLDAGQIMLSPMMAMRVTGNEMKRNIKYMPGSIIPVSQPGDIAPLTFDTSNLLASINEENITSRDAEEYIGVFDPGVLAEGTAERRTATEVDAIMQQTQSIFGQDARLLQANMKKVHKQLWHLLLDFGPDEEYFRVIGEDMPRLMKKHEIAHDYDIVPAGTPANTSRQLAMARAREALGAFLNDTSGLVNKHELIKWYFNTLDRNMAKLVVRTPEQAALIQQMFQTVAQSGQQPANPP